ncbi:fatty acyl-CoA reductase wat [Plutella xylostella]|uniref:fatty acyl-CoA reductase wat n=1 Tax=Plutella xylostella TaxID=51655 RepID=UPI002032F5E5|nr:fatty acyl-CoA reductase wat [Plutella xylostella]
MLSRMRAVRGAGARGGAGAARLYGGAGVLVTGGTGFLGRQLLEKLLRACNGIKKIYLLTRVKKGKSMEERLKEQMQDPVYDELRKTHPDFESKIEPIEGDITELRLGIKDEDWKKIADEITVIFHGAATVRFDEPLKVAVLTNVRSVREIIALGRECANLKSLVYYSTAYAHCNRQEIRETFYDCAVSPSAIIDFVETVDEKKIAAMEPILIEGWPNTYTYSKAIAEETLRTMGAGLPICVVRPAIVSPAIREPSPGWVDVSNCNGPSGVILGVGMGIIHTMLAKSDIHMDIVPVDCVNNLAIAASWETARRHALGEKDIQIYTLSRHRNHLTWEFLQNFCETKARKLISPAAVWYAYSLTTSSQLIYQLLTLFLHFIPAVLIDAVLIVLGKQLRLTRLYKRVYKINAIFLKHFVFHSWTNYDDNTLQLYNSLSEDDKQIFDFDIAKIDSDEFMSIWCLGLRKYIIKDNLQGTEKAIKRQAVLKVVNALVLVLYSFMLWKMFLLMFSGLKYLGTGLFLCVGSFFVTLCP